MAAEVGGDVETRQFWRSPHIPGFELVEAKKSVAEWRVYNLEYTIGVLDTWAGRVHHDGRASDVSSGQALLFRPGEFLSSTGAARPGDLRVMIISGSAIQQYAGEYLDRPTELEWKSSLARCSDQLFAAFHRVFSDLHRAPSALQFQSTMADFFSLMVRELVVRSKPTQKLPDGSRQAMQMRELMHHATDGLTMGLSELADAVGMTRFQALRAFKRKYGVPPHAYQLAVRVGVSANLLGRGESVTDVAHAMGFTDQSHFTRHFKRLWRVTPGSYSRAKPLPSLACTSRSDGVFFST